MNSIEPDKKVIQESLCDLMSPLNESERKLLMDTMTWRSYNRGELIYREGDIPRQLFCLITGKVKIYKDGVGRSQIMRVLKPVEYFGYRAAFSQQAFITAAAALESSFIVKFPLNIIEQLILTNTRLGWFFVQQLAMALGRSDERTVTLTQKHLRARLAESIFYLRERYGVESDGITLSSRLSREDMANLSSMTTNNAIRTLSLFTQEGLLQIEGRCIRIIDEDGLRRVAEIG